MFNSESGKLAGQIGGKIGGAVKSEAKARASRATMEAAREAGKLTGRPSLGCTCGHAQHNSTCRVYMAQKKRESRMRLKERAAPPVPKVKKHKPLPADDLSWVKNGIYPLRPDSPLIKK